MMFSMFAQENQKAIFWHPETQKKPVTTTTITTKLKAKTPQLTGTHKAELLEPVAEDSVFAKQTNKRRRKRVVLCSKHNKT